MKIPTYLFLFILATLNSFGQDTTYLDSKRIQLSIQTAACYKTFLDSRYIEPKSNKIGDQFTLHQYERFKKVPTFGFSFGFLLNFRLGKNLDFVSGLQYFLRRDVFENNQDTVIKYGNGSNIRDIHNAVKYDYTFNNLEIPIMVMYSSKKIALYAGSYFSLMTYKKVNYTYILNQYSMNPQWVTSSKTISGFQIPINVFPTIQAMYKLQIKNREISPFIGVYFAIKNQNDIFFQLGIHWKVK